MSGTRLSTNEAIFIANNSLGCRAGVDPVNAAYGFMDIVGEGQDGTDPQAPPHTILMWQKNPSAEEFHPRWDFRLWNTCGVIVKHKSAGTVLLVTKATPSAERYRFGVYPERGDGFSFRKANALSGSKKLATIHYGQAGPTMGDEGLGPGPTDFEISEEQVQELFDKIRMAIAQVARR